MKVVTEQETGSSMLTRIAGALPPALRGHDLKAKLFRGGTWMGAGSFAEQVTRFARNMILARLLAPEAFGTMAIVLSAGSVIHTITDMGVKEAIIQNPRGTEESYASAAWWLALGRGLSLYALIFLLAPWMSSFYGSHELAPLLRVVGLGVILDGALSSKAYIAIKEMKFGKWAIINNLGGILGVVITVLLSFLMRDVWALVLGNVAESACRCLLSYILCPYLPSFSWEKAAASDLLQFSKGLFGLSFLNLIFMRTDVFVLAKLYTPVQLGLYVMAVSLIQTPSGFVMNLLGQTLLPTFSHVQDNDARVNRILIQVSAFLAFVGIPGFVFMIFCGRALLTLAYGHSYAAAAVPLVAASFVALINLLNGQVTTVFYSKGAPQLHRTCVVIMAAIMIVAIYPFVKSFGLVGGQIACLVSILSGYSFQLLRVHRITGLDLGRYAKAVIHPAVISLVVGFLCLGARYFPPLAAPLPTVVLGIIASLLAYALGAFAFLRNSRSLA
jgi:lipopolysaccharide exporter